MAFGNDIARAWMEYGRSCAKHKSLWDGSLAFASGPLMPEGDKLRDYSGRTAGAVWSVGAGDVPKYTQGSVRGQGFWAGRYDGSNDYATVAYPAQLGLAVQSKPFAFSWWSKSTNNATGFVGLLAAHDSINGLLMVYYNDSYNGLIANRVTGAGTIAVKASAAFDETLWHHFALVSNGADLSLWIDGATSTATGIVLSASISPGVDLGRGYSTLYGAVSIAAMIVHSRLLTTAEITILSTHPLAAYEVKVPRYYFVGGTAATHLWPWQIRRMRRTAGAR